MIHILKIKLYTIIKLNFIKSFNVEVNDNEQNLQRQDHLIGIAFD